MTNSEFKDWLSDPHRRPLVMGILNVTPDSFSDGGRFSDVSVAIARAEEMAAAGASVIDVGGESTRPGSQPVDPQEQIGRVVPVIQAVHDRVHAVISVDTTRSEVAEAAFDAGATLINDIFSGRDDARMLPLAASRRAPIILMHMQGTPATMQANPTYGNVVREVITFLRERIEAAREAGVEPANILIDPGIGFGKTIEHNLALLKAIAEFKVLGHPLVVGSSRKGFIGKITGEDLASGRPFGTAATIAWAVANGTDLVRVHDVAAMSQVVRMIKAIQKND